MRPRATSAALATALLALLLAALIAAPGAAGAGPRLVPLHATRGEDPGIFDARGREVLLRGVNVNALGDYYQAEGAPIKEEARPQ